MTENEIIRREKENNCFVKFVEQKNDLYFNFPKYLKLDTEVIDIDYFSYCNIKNRTILNNLGTLAEQLNYLFEFMKEDLDKEFYENYFSLFVLSKTEGISIKMGKNIIDSVISQLIEPINKVAQMQVEVCTPPDVNLTNDGKKELYFTKVQLLRIIKIIILSKLMLIPTNSIIGVTEADKQIKKYIQERVLLTKFSEDEADINILNKIQKLCFSRLLATVYSDRRFWQLAELHGFSPLTYSNLLFKKIITTTIIVMHYDKNPINFLDVFIKNNIKWLFKKKFNVVYNIIDASKGENDFDIISELINSELMNKNISTNIVIREKILNYVKDVMKVYKKEAYIKELFLLLDGKFRRNFAFKYITIPYISKTLNIENSILLSVNRKIFIFLTIITYIKLIENNFLTLGAILLSNMTNDLANEKKSSPSNYKKVKALKNDKEFKRIIDTKYKVFADNKNLIYDEVINVIATLYYNKFTSIVDNKQVPVDLSVLKREYLGFINTLL